MSRKSEANTKFDKLLGNKIKERRLALGMSRADLAQFIGVTHQQLGKNELGENRIAASRIPDFARALQVGHEFFFDKKTVIVTGRDRLKLEVSRNFSKLDEITQMSINELVRKLAGIR